MKILISFFTVTLFSLYCFGSGVVVVVSPDNPTAGQVVTFTIEANVTGCEIQTGDGAILNLAVDASNQFTSATHTYTNPGDFMLDGDCDFGPISFTTSNFTFITTLTVAPAPINTPIPTLGEWGLILLSLIMLGVGMVYLGQRQRNTQGIS